MKHTEIGGNDLFAIKQNSTAQQDKPFALKVAPVDFDGFVGQDEILGPGKLLRRIIDSDKISSLIFFGPSGTGKSALARIVSKKTKSHFVESNAVMIGVNDLRKIIDEAYNRKQFNAVKTILLLDEIHHFNRTQQDALLPYVEKGIITLIGITTENPYFYINSALLSRSLVFQFKAHTQQDIEKIIHNALKNPENGINGNTIDLKDDALKHILKYAEGDARKALNALEIGIVTSAPSKDGKIVFDLKLAEESTQNKSIVYDKSGDAHYDHISAFIKSIRGSDPDAALYWMAKMLEAGEDPRFIARRIIIAASEDVGNADPQALQVAISVLQAIEFVGMPEGRIPLAQAVTYVATAPKSNASYLAISAAQQEVKNGKLRDVPNHLKDASVDGEKLGHGKGYKYPHSFEGHFVEQEYMPEHKEFYTPSEEGFEAIIKKRMAGWKKQ
ncbi:MAG: replication-associated recombination protein A [Elusimicrobia bacterium]|nr:replication-associated recombination protein A [Elusimicrobiota bacterium]MBU2615391.1 replication-associated recombination protein A [Elusimicrobiota bacterium]